MIRFDDHTAIDCAELEGLIARLESIILSESGARTIERLLRLLVKPINVVEQKDSSIAWLKRLLFGPGAEERTRARSQTEAESRNRPTEADSSSVTDTSGSLPAIGQAKRRGHGRLSASAYTGVAVVDCIDPALGPSASAPCPHDLCSGRLYDTCQPSIFIRLTGQPLVRATRYHQQVLRCSACQQRYTALLPEGVPAEKYAATADIAIALAKYAGRIPFYCTSRMQRDHGVPLPESVQFERSEAVADDALPIFLHLKKQQLA